MFRATGSQAAKGRLREWLKPLATKLLITFLLFSVAENVLLLRQVRSLKEAVSESASRREPAPALGVGDTLPEFTATDPEGLSRKVDCSGDRLLFVYSASCPFCEKNFENWRAIEKQVGRENVIYLSLDPAAVAGSHADSKGIRGQAWVLSDPQERSKLKVSRIPQTIYVRDGTIKAIHVGVIPPDTIQQFKAIHRKEG